jgi:hypothetical protein
MSLKQQLERLVSIGERFRNTPIVDDDFPAMRDAFDRELEAAKQRLANPQYENVIVDGCMGKQEIRMEV